MGHLRNIALIDSPAFCKSMPSVWRIRRTQSIKTLVRFGIQEIMLGSSRGIIPGNREAPGAEDISKFLNTAMDRRPMAP